MCAATAQLSALGEKERELAAARQRANTLEAELADLERECALRQAQEQVGHGNVGSGWVCHEGFTWAGMAWRQTPLMSLPTSRFTSWV